jgi:hypothetical protein
VTFKLLIAVEFHPNVAVLCDAYVSPATFPIETVCPCSRSDLEPQPLKFPIKQPLNGCVQQSFSVTTTFELWQNEKRENRALMTIRDGETD